MNEYDAQAQEFLDSTKTTINLKYKGHYKYFDTDEYARDVYDVTLTNVKGSYTFTFGQSYQNSDWSKYAFYILYRLFPFTKRLTLSELESQIQAQAQKFKAGKLAPTPYDVLTSLGVWTGTFEDFCTDFGYDTDSRRAEKFWKAVIEQSFELQKLFSEEELERLAEIA